MPLLALAGSVGKIVAILALLPPWILIYLVSGKQGMKGGWPLAVVGSLGYIAGQLPTSIYLGPYLPDVIGAIVCFACLLILLKVWHPAQTLGYGGVPVTAEQEAAAEGHGLSAGDVFQGWLPIIVLVVVVVLWTGPWSPLPAINWLHLAVSAASSITAGATITAAFDFKPFVGGSAIMAVLDHRGVAAAGQRARSLAKSSRRPGRRCGAPAWSACSSSAWLIVFNFSGMAGSLAKAFSALGPYFIVVAPILGFIGVALSGSNTSTNAMFGKFQALVGQLLGFPLMLLPVLNSVGAEIGKPIAPQTASVGVSTSEFVRNEGEVIRHNFGWTLVLLVYLVLIGVACYLFFPGIAVLPKA